jgi:hypothetical protein
MLLGQLFGRKDSPGGTVFCGHCGRLQDGLVPVPGKGRPRVDFPESAGPGRHFSQETRRGHAGGKPRVEGTRQGG